MESSISPQLSKIIIQYENFYLVLKQGLRTSVMLYIEDYGISPQARTMSICYVVKFKTLKQLEKKMLRWSINLSYSKAVILKSLV